MGLVGTGAGFTEAAMYTNPDVAIEFIQKTGVDALAVSFGSTHGDYPQGYVPTFHFEIVEAIRSATDVPLVLHGGSGSGAENIRRAITCGINKINVGTDYMIAQRDFVAKALQTDPDIEYPELLHRAYLEASKVVQSYIELAGSKGRAW